MASIISFQERVQSRYFDYKNFIDNYRRLPADKQQRVATMLLGFYTRQLMECGIDGETVENIYGTLGEEYQDMLLDMVNEQVVRKGERACQN